MVSMVITPTCGIFIKKLKIRIPMIIETIAKKYTSYLNAARCHEVKLDYFAYSSPTDIM